MIPSEIIKNEYLVSKIIEGGCPEIINYIEDKNIMDSFIVQNSLNEHNISFSL